MTKEKEMKMEYDLKKVGKMVTKEDEIRREFGYNKAQKKKDTRPLTAKFILPLACTPPCMHARGSKMN